MKRFINSLIVLMLLLAMLPAQSAAGSYCVDMVTNTNDAGAGSLRQVLSGVCDIGFDPSLSGATITLETTLRIGRNVIIDASGLASKVTISGNNLVRVFWVNPGVTVTMDSLIIADGQAIDEVPEYGTFGGGIHNAGGTLTVRNSILSHNYAGHVGGGIYSNGGTVNITNSTLISNSAGWLGGGIMKSGTGALTIIDSTLSLNRAEMEGGGGIYNEYSTVYLFGSTLVGNSAPRYYGGGIYNLFGTTTVSNSTFSENSASGWGSAVINYGILRLFNSTLSGNSGAIALVNTDSGAQLYYYNTIVANTSGVSYDCANNNGATILANVNNLVEMTYSSIAESCNPSLTSDPLLYSLADNGGPTQTMALQAGSPAIDAGDDAACTAAPVSGLDQRGKTRPYGDHCDIGAYELRPDISPNTLPPATVGFSYSQQLTAVGGTPPYQWSSIGLGPVLGINSETGELTSFGVFLTTAGEINFTSKWYDSVGGQFSKAYTLIVSPALTFSPGTLPTGRVNEAYSQVITLAGGTAPYTITPDSLPAWLSSIVDSSAGTITLSGTPTSVESFSLKLQAKDAVGVKGVKSYGLWTGPQRAFTWSPESPYQGDEVTFTPSSEYGLTSISWWRGDACESNIPTGGSVAYVTFGEIGTYQICMRYWVDSINDFAWDKQSVTVNPKLGELKISKVFDPLTSGFTGTFTVFHDCGGEYWGYDNVGAGSDITFYDIPIGSHCTVTESTLPTPPTGWSFGTPTYTPADGTVTISETLAEVTVTNTIIPNTQSYDVFLPIIIR